MTVRKTTLVDITCNVCGKTTGQTEGVATSDEQQLAHVAAREVRAVLTSKGWLCAPTLAGPDLCPDCNGNSPAVETDDGIR